MPYNGAGIFQALPPPQYPAIAGDIIRASYFNAVINDLIAGLTNSVTRNGQSPPTSNLPMAGLKHTDVGDATAADQYASYGQLLDAATTATFVQDATGAFARTIGGKLQDVVSVLDFIPESEHAGIRSGALTFDCAPAINAALAAKQFVYMPAGTYRVDTPINLKAQAQAGLIGESYMLTSIQAGASMTSIIDLYDTTDLYAGIAEYKIHDLNLNGNSLATYGMYIRYRHKIDARGVRVAGCSLAFWMADSWMCNFWDCYSHFNINGGFHLEGANHNSTYNQCHVTGANTGPAVYVGGAARVDGNSDISFNNLLIDACDYTQIVVEMGPNSNVVTFNGGYMGEYAANSRGVSAFVKVVSGKAIFNGSEIFCNDTSVSPETNGGLALFWRAGGEAIFKDCSIALYSYAYLYHGSSNNTGSLTIEDCNVTNGAAYELTYLASGLYDLFPVKDYAYKITPKHFGRDMTFYQYLPSGGSFAQTFPDREAQKIDATAAGGFASLSMTTNTIPNNTGYYLVFLEYSSNMEAMLRFTSTPLGSLIWSGIDIIPSTSGTRSTMIGLMTDPGTFNNTPAVFELTKKAANAWAQGDYSQVWKFAILPIKSISYSRVNFEF